MTQEEILEVFRQTGALLEGHFVLTSGYHSPHYFQCAKILQYPKYLTVFSSMISDYFKDDDIDIVISPAIGGIVLGTEVGRLLNVRTIFAERENDKLTLRRGFSLQKDLNVLAVEDVVTTGGSLFELIDIIKNSGCRLAGVGYIIDRSNGKVDFKTKQIALAKFDVVKFRENDIPDWLEEIPVTKPGSRKPV
ncbi:MAG: orotate phosphoribosyltransferase [Ignavibacteria bacterium]|nr:orotate phosphoribosyltransferase [Ignavibacteria bacterium]